MSDTKIQWHPGFVAAMNLEFAENRDDLIFDKEHNLNTRPRGLFQYFNENGYTLSNPNKGIYYVTGRVMFPTQIVVTGELDRTEHIWIGALSAKLDKRDMWELIERIRLLRGKMEREFADSVLEVSIGANLKMMEEWKGDAAMCQALMELMEPQLQKRDEEKIEEGIQKGIQKGIQRGLLKGMQEGRQEGIRGTVNVLRKYGIGNAEIIKMIMEQYSLSEAEAKGYL